MVGELPRTVLRIDNDLAKLLDRPTPALRAAIDAEKLAARFGGVIISYQGAHGVVPDLLQTGDYRRELADVKEGSVFDAQQKIAALRRELIRGHYGSYAAFIGAQVLRPPAEHSADSPAAGISPETHRDQINQLIAYGEAPDRVTVRVVPEDIPAEELPASSFHDALPLGYTTMGGRALIAFGESQEGDVVTDSVKLADFAEKGRRLYGLALSPEDSLDFMRQIATAL